MVRKQVHIVPHMHWDREWYFTTEESRILLVNNLEEIMDMLENNPDYPFYVLDGQTAVLEDYFAVKPENRQRIQRLVSQGKLILGPWYTQTDEMIVGGESIVRNLLYGLKDTEAFGDPMLIGYLPDSFGQSAQMPQILNGFGITRSIFWRGASERHGTNKTEFYWESDDGSKVLVQLMPLGYAIGKYLPENELDLKTRMDKYFDVLDRGATTEHVLLPNGHDQMPVQKNIFTIIDKLSGLYPERDFFLSRYEKLFEHLEQQTGLALLKGEFLDGKYMRVHRSIYSTRMDIKATNTRIESKLTNILEPLASIAYSLGFEYHHGLIELIWKEIMKNHAHDSIGCCCSDKVHREIENRFFLAEEKTDQLIHFYMRKIVDSMETNADDDRVTAFNLLPYEREEVITTTIITKMDAFQLLDDQGESIPFEVLNIEETDPGLIDRQIVHYGNYDPFITYTLQWKDRIPAMGYKTYYVNQGTTKNMMQSVKDVQTVETDFFTITTNSNGTLHIIDKHTGQTYEQVLRLEDGGDDGDEYDYSPLADEQLIYSDDVQAKTSIRQNRYETVIDIQYALIVPQNLESRRLGAADSTMGVHITATVPHHKSIISLKFDIENQAEDHRLRVMVPTGISSLFSVSDNQFGHIKRPVHDSALEVWEQEQWDERPDGIYPMLTYVGLSDKEHGVAVFTRSSREFEIVGEKDDTIAITLFRSVGVLGKENLIRRPGRPSGIKLPTPDSQLIGGLSLEFAIMPHSGTTLSAGMAREAKEYLTPIQCYNKIPYDAMKLNASGISTPTRYSFLSEELGKVVISTLKKAENSMDYVLRFYNAHEVERIAKFHLPAFVQEADLANLNEEPQDFVSVDNNTISVPTAMNQMKTILLRSN